jgi:hypothetical protein
VIFKKYHVSNTNKAYHKVEHCEQAGGADLSFLKAFWEAEGETHIFVLLQPQYGQTITQNTHTLVLCVSVLAVRAVGNELPFTIARPAINI